MQTKMPGQHRQDTRAFKSRTDGQQRAHQTRPEALPEIAWLEVAELKVDHSYQHPPYVGAIEQLHREYKPEWSGFILVNERADGSLWIVDGQTRRAVHERRGLAYIRAEILRGLTPEQEAVVYLVKCKNTQRVPVDAFLAEYAARYPMAVLLHDLLAKRGIAVISYATEHQAAPAKAVISCVKTLKDCLKRDEDGSILEATLDLIVETWSYHHTSFGGNFIRLMHDLILRHGDEIDRKSFVTRLSAHSVPELREMGRALKNATTPALSEGKAMQRKVIELYNVGRQTRRIEL